MVLNREYDILHTESRSRGDRKVGKRGRLTEVLLRYIKGLIASTTLVHCKGYQCQ